MKIKFENISYRYNGTLPRQRQALIDVNMEISEGELIGIIGSSGSGKTTLLQHFTGLLKPTGGKIYIDGQDIWSKNFRLAELRKKIGIVFQFPETQLFEETVFADVAFGPRALNLSDKEVEERANEALRLVGMNSERIKNRPPYQLSEGEKRRVALAGVLAMAPEMLVLDEITAGLDPAGIKQFVRILKQLNAQGITILTISHNMDVILQLARRIIVLHEGKICFDGDRRSLFNQEEFLTKLDLNVPRIIRLCRYLHRKEILPEWEVYSPDELKDKIKSLNKKT